MDNENLILRVSKVPVGIVKVDVIPIQNGNPIVMRKTADNAVNP